MNVTITVDAFVEIAEQLLAVLRTQDGAVKLGTSTAPIVIMDSSGKDITKSGNLVSLMLLW